MRGWPMQKVTLSIDTKATFVNDLLKAKNKNDLCQIGKKKQIEMNDCYGNEYARRKLSTISVGVTNEQYSTTTKFPNLPFPRLRMAVFKEG